MPLHFNDRGSAVNENLLLIIFLAVSLVCTAVYTVEGEGGPLHAVQNAVGMVASPVRTVGAGIQSVQMNAQAGIDDMNADASTLSELREQNEQLRQMVSELEEYRQTAQRLEGIQQLRDLYAIEGVSCHVTSMSGNAWDRVVTIDKGSDDGVQAGMPVMGPTGLVGQVKSVSGGSAEVRLLQDPKSGVAVLIQSNRAEGLLKGSIDGLLYLEDVDTDIEVKVGDAVITSGLGGGYFRGLMVGTVVRVEDTSGQAIRQIVVAPNDTVRALEEVLVVTGVGSEGALSADSASGDAARQAGSADQDAAAASESEGSSAEADAIAQGAAAGQLDTGADDGSQYAGSEEEG